MADNLQFITVTFFAMPGSVEPTSLSIQKDSPYGNLVRPTPPKGYYFVGWYDENDLLITSGMVANEDITLYAHYKKDTTPSEDDSSSYMLYRLLVDNVDCLDYRDMTLVLLSPRAELELDAAGSLEFTVPPTHKFYNRFTAESIMGMTLELWEDDVQHWFGRPVELELDFYKNKKIFCEGAMGYFNDTIQRPKEYDGGVMLSQLFQDFINNHNNMAAANRRFIIDKMLIPDHEVYRKIEYEKSSDMLKSKLLDTEYGHMYFERRNGVNYISWLPEDNWPYTCNQPVEFGKNLLDLSYSFDGKDFATCILPLGATVSDTGQPLTIASVNSGSDILVGNAAENYGQIVTTETYNDITDPTELMNEAKKLLTRLQYNATIIEGSAVDLHSKDSTKTAFRIGQLVSCVSPPHSIAMDLPLSKLSISLDSASKQISLGRIPKKTLTRFYKGGSTITGSAPSGSPDIPSGWVVVPPEEDGGTPTLKTVPIAIHVTKLPTKYKYHSEEIIDYSGIEVRAVSKWGETLSDEPEWWVDEECTYSNGALPYRDSDYESNLIFLTSTMPKNPSKSSPIFTVEWLCPYNGKSYQAKFALTNLDAEAERQAAIEQHGSEYPDHIEAIVSKIGGVDPQVYLVGSYTRLDGVSVYAYYPDNEPYDANGYTNGFIPKTELSFEPKIIDDAMGDKYIPTNTSGVGAFLGHINNGAYDRTFTLLTDSSVYWSLETDGSRNRYTGPIVVSKEPFSVHCEDAYAAGFTRDFSSLSTIYDNSTFYYFWAWGIRMGNTTTITTIDEYLKKIGAHGEGNYVNISWKAPDNNILTTRFEITVVDK